MSVETDHATPAPDQTSSGLTSTGKLGLFAAPLLLAVAGWGSGAFVHKKVSAPVVAATPVAAPDGAKLFAANCASCHGERGDGKGVAAVDPPARHFGFERFKFALTANGTPTDADLTKVIRNGITGSAMPAFPTLTDAECAALIAHVRRLTWAGAYARFLKKALKDFDDGGDDPNPQKIAKQADDYCRVEKPIELPAAFAAATPEAVSRGRAIYQKSCASCHGPEGKGDGPQVKDLKNEDGTPNRPRDLTSGVYKGGGEPHVLYARIRLGIPGTPMPATPTLTYPETADLIHFVRSLSRPTTVAAK